MPPAPRSPVHHELPHAAARPVARLFFATTAFAATAGALLLAPATQWPTLPHDGVLAFLAGLAALAIGAALAARYATHPGFPMGAALCGVAGPAILFCSALGVLLQDGLRNPALGFHGLIVCLVGAIAGFPLAVVAGALTLATLGGLAWIEWAGVVPSATASTPLWLVLAYHGLIVLCAVIGGGLISRALKQHQDLAQVREQRFAGLLQIAADWYWEQDRDFRFTYTSEASAEVSGISTSDRMHRRPWEIEDIGLTPLQLDAHRADLEAHRPFSGLLARRRSRQGRWRIFDISGQPRFDTAGEFTGYWGVARDVTDEVRAQRAVLASETRYRELFSRSPSALLLHRRGVVIDANEAAASLFGFPSATAMTGFDSLQLVPPGETRQLVVERMGALERMSVGQALPVRDFQVQSIQGQRLSVQATAVRVDTPSGPANLSIYVDITARKAAEAALQRSEALLSHLFATSADCISLSEAATGRFAMVNPAYTQVLGYAGDQIIGRTSLELGLWQDPNDRQRLLAQLERDGHATDFRCTMVARSGAPVTMVLAVGRFMMDGREYLVINSRDVTQSERTRQQHAAILERASIGIAFTQDQRFVQVNPHFERMFGWTAQELVGQPGIKVWPSAAEYEEVGRQAGPLLASGRPYRMERRMRRRDGSEFWCRATAQALDRADPSRSGTIWITEDVSERRRFDEALASALEAAQAANRAKGNFLANTSHEIRTPLNGLLGLARLAMQEGLSESRRQSCLAQILDSAQSLADILSDILDLSKIESGKFSLDPQPFDLRELLGVLHKAYGALAEVKGLTLRLEIDAQLPSLVHGDAVRVRQILSNLLNNALKFTDHGHITLRAAPVAARGLRLTVTDTGPGVPAPLQSQLFTPFSQGDSSTTRRHGGTGLGLSICRELAELMGGRVGLDSTPGVGSSFWAELPLAPAVALPARVDTEALDRVPLRGARVLLAEDNPVNMMIGVALLEDWGVQVTQAADGRSAVDQVLAAARAGRAFDAVLMDVQMPLMSGHEAARELRADPLAATLPIVALTAAALVSERDEALAAGMNAFLTKPIDANQLRQTLARQLADRAA